MYSSLKDYIVVVEDQLSHEQCDKLVSRYQDTDWEVATVGDGTGENHEDMDVRNCFHIPVYHPKDFDLFQGRLNEAIKAYSKKFPHIITHGNTGVTMLRYLEGGFYKQHTDFMQVVPRVLSLSWAINDDYEGGEWGFFENEYKFKIPKGALLMFPSNFMYPHQINPVTKGTRYSVISWLV